MSNHDRFTNLEPNASVERLSNEFSRLNYVEQEHKRLLDMLSVVIRHVDPLQREVTITITKAELASGKTWAQILEAAVRGGA